MDNGNDGGPDKRPDRGKGSRKGGQGKAAPWKGKGSFNDRNRPFSGPGQWRPRKQVAREDRTRLFLYGLHTVAQAIANPRRRKLTLFATLNALDRMGFGPEGPQGVKLEITDPRRLDRMVGSDAVHQGAVLEVEPLDPLPLARLSGGDLLIVLDQVTDPHNVGAVMRSGVAFGAGAIITTSRHSPAETGVLAKSASGALDVIDLIEVRNLAECLQELNAMGYRTVGLDSEAPNALEEAMAPQGGRMQPVALVLGAEGKGLRARTRETCDVLARIDLPGAIVSLNVSNAAAVSLYVARRMLGEPARG
jgi:23S rRNA (guanosine2251-2'-O)-methyltransferase